MAFILRGWQPHIDERPEAFELMLLPCQVPFEWISNLDGIFALRKLWQHGLSASWDENLRYLFTATSQVASQYLDNTWTGRPGPLHSAMLVWYRE